MSRHIDADKLERDLKYRYEQLEKEYGCYDSYVEAKMEAYKEFSDKLKTKFKRTYINDAFKVRCLGIHVDDLLKEMLGEQR